jgi:hypothetical protein
VEQKVSSRRLKDGEIRASCSCGRWSIAGKWPEAINREIELHERKSR